MSKDPTAPPNFSCRLEYLNLVDWKGLELSSKLKKECTESVENIERFPTAWSEWVKLKKLSYSFKLREARRHQMTKVPRRSRNNNVSGSRCKQNLLQKQLGKQMYFRPVQKRFKFMNE